VQEQREAAEYLRWLKTDRAELLRLIRNLNDDGIDHLRQLVKSLAADYPAPRNEMDGPPSPSTPTPTP
jgi:hypothetical protein